MNHPSHTHTHINCNIGYRDIRSCFSVVFVTVIEVLCYYVRYWLFLYPVCPYSPKNMQHEKIV